MKIKEVVVPAAGLGTRFLPFTKSIPKEMLPIINTPAIEFIAKEAVDSGIMKFFIIISQNKKAICDYFKPFSKNSKLIHKDKLALFSTLESIINCSSFSFINQEKQMGLGHAILMSENSIKEDYFAVMLPDDLIIYTEPAIFQLIKIAQDQNASVVAVQEVPYEHTGSYGIVKTVETISSDLFKVSELIEKPDPKDSPSNLAIIGRYILSKKIFESLKKIGKGNNNELQLTDAICHMLKNGERVLAYRIKGKRYDIGNPAGWLTANIEIGNSKLHAKQ